jgi:iron complex outermembrane receptor protein
MDRQDPPRDLASAARTLTIASGALFLALAVVAPAWAGTTDADRRPLEELSLEELMRVEVTTVVGVRQENFASPAALYVITAEDIRRSGHRTLFEILRLVPGMFVGRSGSSGGVAGPRGLTGNLLTSNRMLVLIDGRVVYDPLFNGPLWDVQDVVLEDIERIEVIRGPGATLWGLNAMNGVINVVTRSAQDTQGLLVIAGGGDPEKVFATARYGGQLAGGAAYSVWGKYSDHAPLDLVNGETAHDQWTRARGGFRVDGGGATGLAWTVQGDAYRHPTTRVSTRQPVPDRHLQFEQVLTDDDIDGGHLQFGLGRGAGQREGWHLRGIYDHTSRQTSRLGMRRDSFDLDFRKWSDLGERHLLLWGLHANHIQDDLDDGPTFHFDPMELSWSKVNGFVQVTRTLVQDRLFGLLGTKVTYHDFIGLQVQPSARIWWTPSERKTLWAALSRPVRVPSRLERDGLIVVAYADPGLLAGRPPTGVRPFGVAGDRDLDPEFMVAYELGYRQELASGWQLDAALFCNDYRRLISVPASVVGSFVDTGSGESIGAEVRAVRQISGRWRLELSASWIDLDLEGPVLELDEGAVPEGMVQARSSWDVTERFQVHAALYHVGELDSGIDSYERLDVGLTWRLRDDVELALWGQNLIEPHAELGPVEVPRGGYLQVRLDL